MSSINEFITYLHRFTSRDELDKDYCQDIVHPIRDNQSWNMYKKQESSYWTADSIVVEGLANEFKLLDEESKQTMLIVMAFLTTADNNIIDIISMALPLIADSIEKKFFYTAQLRSEVTHAETYSKILYELEKDASKRNKLIKSVHDNKAIRDKNDWISKSVLSARTKVELLTIYTCIEGIYFLAPFLYLFWIRRLGILRPISFSNEEISKDECLHKMFGIYNIKSCMGVMDAVTLAEVKTMITKRVREASHLELSSCKFIFKKDRDGLLLSDIEDYIRFLSDDILINLDIKPIYEIKKSSLPSWISELGMEIKTNFYEDKVGNYKSSVIASDCSEEVYNNPMSVLF